MAGRAFPETLAEIRAIGLIGVERDNAVIRAMGAGGLDIGLDGFCFRSDSDLAHIAAIRAGIGIGVCQVPLAARDPALIRLVPAFSYPLEVWVAMHEDVRGSAPVRAVFDALAEGLGAYLATAG
jgi:DNA-binding transcriptional LysR family regulator